MIDKRTYLYHKSSQARKEWTRVLIVGLAILSWVAYARLPAKTPISPLGQVEAKEAVEVIVEPPKPSSRVKGCVKNHPFVSGRIEAKFEDAFNAKELICRESSFNPTIINKSSGACGLAQALPCSKMKCDLADVDCQLDWINDYVTDRYGSFEKAIEFHNEKGWY